MRDRLVLENLKLIYLVIKNLHLHYKTEDELQDYYDAGLEGLIIGSKKYDSSKGLPSTYLYSCISNEIKKFIKFKNTAKRKINYEFNLSLSETIHIAENGMNIFLEDVVYDPKVNVLEMVERNIEKEKIMYLIKNKLNEKEQIILSMYYGLNGYPECNQKQIAKIFNTSTTTIGTTIYKIKEKLKKEYAKKLIIN